MADDGAVKSLGDRESDGLDVGGLLGERLHLGADFCECESGEGSSGTKRGEGRTSENLLSVALAREDEQDVGPVLSIRREDDLDVLLLLERLDLAPLLPDQVTVNEAVDLDDGKVGGRERANDGDDLGPGTCDSSGVLSDNLDERGTGFDGSGAGEVDLDAVVDRELAELGLAEDVASEVRRVELLVERARVGGEEVEGVDEGSVGLLVDLQNTSC